MLQTALLLVILETTKGKRARWVAPCIFIEQQAAKYDQEKPQWTWVMVLPQLAAKHHAAARSLPLLPHWDGRENWKSESEKTCGLR